MPIYTKWLVPNRVIVSSYEGEIVEDDLPQLSNDLARLFDEGTPPIHFISVMENLDKPLINMSAMKSSLSILRDDRLGWALSYGQSTNSVIRFLGGALTGMFGIKSRMFNTREQAVEFLAGADPSLSSEELYRELEALLVS